MRVSLRHSHATRSTRDVYGNLNVFVCVCACAGLPEVLREKELRAQQRLERSAEERGRRMGEQRRREQDRRAAAEEKRRQHAEGEKVRGQTDDAAVLLAPLLTLFLYVSSSSCQLFCPVPFINSSYPSPS